MKRTRIKPAHSVVVKTSISLAPSLYEVAIDRVKKQGFSSLSGYIQSLVRKDGLPA